MLNYFRARVKDGQLVPTVANLFEQAENPQIVVEDELLWCNSTLSDELVSVFLYRN